jgi:2'-5' RNA ligase
VSARGPGWRCFVAVAIGEKLRAELAAVVGRWRTERDGPNLRWTDVGGWHVTLAFLGQLAPALIAPIGDVLGDLASHAEPFRVESGGLGAFPSRGRARVVWYRITDPAAELATLAAEVRTALAPMVPRLANEDTFRPHLTLARARDERGISLTDWLAGHEVPSGAIDVNWVILFRSHLGGGPAQYEALRSLPLGGHVPQRAMLEVPTHG